MRKALEGSHAIALAVGRCRPGVIAAYPITPQTHIVEKLSSMVADGELHCELVSVESEFSAASVVLGASAAGSRAYTASSSQGILLMSEVLFNIAGLRLPLVLTCANRAVSAPLNIWNDHQDSMAVRDAGWIQLYCADNQEAVDTTIQAFRIAEETELPVMVCVDGFVLTHTLERLEVPDAAAVDAYLPPYQPRRFLDPRAPRSMGTLVGPEAFTEVRASHHTALRRSMEHIVAADLAFAERFGRSAGGLLRTQGPDDAEVVLLTLGSVSGTLAEALTLSPPARPTKLVTLRAFRPFPDAALRAACAGAAEVIVLERAFSPGAGGILAGEVRAALYGVADAPRVHGFVAGLGGRDVPLETAARLLAAIDAAAPEDFRILDVREELLAEEDR